MVVGGAAAKHKKNIARPAGGPLVILMRYARKRKTNQFLALVGEIGGEDDGGEDLKVSHVQIVMD